jgi:hypothetical protein
LGKFFREGFRGEQILTRYDLAGAGRREKSIARMRIAGE